ncbi:mitochondrial ribosomal protein L17 [Lanmaoa asiatica]|nr:mitochondrial ribosomal protein L17 [Lanmaoa asiatica]
MLRNLVSSLFEHEQIRTTLPKAKDAARLAEKARHLNPGTQPSNSQGFLLKPEILPRLFSTFAQRYKERPGGYTRIVQIDNRMGDNAPMALLELVDNPRDFKFEMTARAVGRELLTDKLRWNTPRGALNNGVMDAHASVSDELQLKASDRGQLRSVTRRNLQKVLKYRGRSALAEISQKATAHIVSVSDDKRVVTFNVLQESLLARPILQHRAQVAESSRAENAKAPYRATFPKTSLHAGSAAPGEVRPAGQLAKGTLTRMGWLPGSRLRSARKGPSQPSAYTVQNLRLA